jgi:hypothetical protein
MFFMPSGHQLLMTVLRLTSRFAAGRMKSRMSGKSFYEKSQTVSPLHSIADETQLCHQRVSARQPLGAHSPHAAMDQIPQVRQREIRGEIQP